MNAPLVSVILPARNAEKTIGNAIVSVLEQTMPDMELIVVDDASTDGTVSVVAAMDAPRIRLLKSQRNIRYAAARNLGLGNARGKWAAFLDADDEWAPERLERLLAATQGREDGFVADLEVLAVPGPSGRLVRARPPAQPEDGCVQTLGLHAFLQMGHDVRPMVPVSAFRRAGVEFPEWGSCGEWTFLLARLSAQGMQGRLVRRAGYFYRAQAAHDSSTLLGREELLHVLEMLRTDPSLPEASRRLLSQRVMHAREGLVAAALRHGDSGKFLRYARRYPRSVLSLPRRALLFAFAKARAFQATVAASRHADPAFRD